MSSVRARGTAQPEEVELIGWHLTAYRVESEDLRSARFDLSSMLEILAAHTGSAESIAPDNKNLRPSSGKRSGTALTA